MTRGIIDVKLSQVASAEWCSRRRFDQGARDRDAVRDPLLTDLVDGGEVPGVERRQGSPTASASANSGLELVALALDLLLQRVPPLEARR
ncbi:hypothetical protein OHS33_11270 [Streptomyces sp. NBC_00536]|uniref:hypothetical protein n=1 Tax=Streptomyces sp. NBC_00536 TaxID=2975769 RepID=UPI002E820AE6|nr:hypothetical protein [Streptomyces sp. NBC_00536]WUC78867.1 hypothetical protein OHS33_11270 [Streptomyces sp. NBC_00536]